jgi:hypothetical protein
MLFSSSDHDGNGVARPKAHGQDMTTRRLLLLMQTRNFFLVTNHDKAETTAMKLQSVQDSAYFVSNFCYRRFGCVAFSTSSIICDKVVSFPMRSARNEIDPDWFIVPVITLSPGFFTMGMLSPVIAD